MFGPADQAPSNWYDPVVLPFILVFFGLLFWVGGRVNETRIGKTVHAKWLGLAMLAFSVLYGLRYPLYLRDGLYAAVINDYPKRWLYVHWAAFLGPLLVLIAAGAWYYFDKRNESLR